MVVGRVLQRDLAFSGLWHGTQFSQVSARSIERNGDELCRIFDEMWVSQFCSSTMCTARSRTSGQYLLDVFITPSSQSMESPVKSGRFICLCNNL